MLKIVLTGDMLFAAIQKSKPSSPGFDGWRNEDLKRLPKVAWDLRARIDNLSLSTSSPPVSYLHIPVAMLRKKGDDPLNHRGIGVYSQLYRNFLRALWPTLVEWLLQIVDDSQTGGIPGRDLREAAWRIQLKVEIANMLEEHLSGILLD